MLSRKLFWNLAKTYLGRLGQQGWRRATGARNTYDSSVRATTAWTMAVNMNAHVHLVLGIYWGHGQRRQAVAWGDKATNHPSGAARRRRQFGREAFAMMVSASGWVRGLAVGLIGRGEGPVLGLSGEQRRPGFVGRV